MENKLEKKLGYLFHNKNLLTLALTHSSYSNESKESNYLNNERLEFLGDATLELVISEYLYNRYPKMTEGDLTKTRASIVCTDSLAESARTLEIGDSIIMGRGEIITGGRTRKSILADTMEAIIGAIYLDGGLEEAKKFIIEQLSTTIANVENGKANRDYKTLLQEMVQKSKDRTLQYRLVKTEGPDHNRTFYIEAVLDNRVIGIGKGMNKKEAEQEAARQAINRLKGE